MSFCSERMHRYYSGHSCPSLNPSQKPSGAQGMSAMWTMEQPRDIGKQRESASRDGALWGSYFDRLSNVTIERR